MLEKIRFSLLFSAKAACFASLHKIDQRLTQVFTITTATHSPNLHEADIYRKVFLLPQACKNRSHKRLFKFLNGFITNILAILLVIALIVWRIGNNSQVNMQSGQTYHQFRGNFLFCCTGQLRWERRVILCYQCVESLPLPMSK